MSQELQPVPEKGAFFSVNRELRRVPLDWQHPKDKEGYDEPLLSRDSKYTDEDIDEMLKDGDIKSKDEVSTWFMPDFSDVPDEKMGICAYECTTEGTPISPVFPNTSRGRFELAKYCAQNYSVFGENKADIESWAGILYGNADCYFNLADETIEIFERPQE